MSTTELITEDEEKERAREIIRGLDLPPEIEGFEIKLGNDSTGDPALWLTFRLKGKGEVGRAELERLLRFTYEAKFRLIDSGVSRFPYTRLEQAA